MKIEFISNKRFCTLNNKDRETLKQSSLNYIIHENKETHYIKEREPEKALNNLISILTEYSKRGTGSCLSIFINPDTYKDLLEKQSLPESCIYIESCDTENSSIELF